jgi:hypothetical protein
MTANTLPTTPQRPIATIHRLLAVQSLMVVLLSINRLSNLFVGYVLPNEFLRWVDFNNMLVIPLISAVVSFVLLKQVEGTTSDPKVLRWQMPTNVLFIIGLYLLAASYGNHEITNYLHQRFCLEDSSSRLCQIIIFNDDEFSHWVFFIGFTLINVSILLMEVLFPRQGTLSRTDRLLLAFNALFIGAGIFANLAFEVIGLDLYVVAFLAVFALFVLWRRGANQPLALYYSVAYSVGLAATTVYKIAVG